MPAYLPLKIQTCLNCDHVRHDEAQSQRFCNRTRNKISEQGRIGCPLDKFVLPDSPIDFILRLIAAGETKPDWHTWPNVQAAYRDLCQEAIAAIPPCPNAGEGRGIVVVGGGRYFISALTNIRLIRHLGCTLPIMLVGLDGELPDWQRQLAAKDGVKCATWGDLAPNHPIGKHHGWELKTVVALFSPFAQTLILDADSFPQRDPTPLFDDPRFIEAGAVFWPDIEHDKYEVGNNMKADVWEMLCVAVRDIPAVESGQQLIDKAKWWRGLWLSNWICQKGWSYYFKFWYGDKNCPQAAAALLDLPYAMPEHRPYSGGAPMLLQRDFDGNPLFAHYTQTKWWVDWQDRKPFADIPLDAQAIKLFKDAREDFWIAQPKPFIVGITVAVSYADYIEATIHNQEKIDDWLIVTVPEDPVIALCEKHGIWHIESDRLHHADSAFNLGALRNDGLAAVKEKYGGRADAWAVFLDGDCRLPNDFRAKVHHAELDKRNIFGAGRWHTDGAAKTDVGVTGFFQLFHLSHYPAKQYRDDYPDAGMTDLVFRDIWPKERQSMLPVEVEHLGKTGVDWKGRKSPPLTIGKIAHGAIGLTKAALHIDRAPDDVIAQRKTICGTCGHHKGGKCDLCGCNLAKKQVIASERCPDSPPRWHAAPPS